MTLIRDGIDSLKLYVPGRPIESVAREYGIAPESIVKMASNENPYGTSPKAVEAMKSEAAKVYLYPDPTSGMLCEKLAQKYSVKPSQIQISAGMDSALLFVVQAFVNEDEEVLTCSPSFDSYRIYTTMVGGKFKTVPLNNHKFDLSALAEAITPKTKVIFLCNPNNPTGTIVSADEVEEFMNRVPEHCVVMFDEAYAEFVIDESYAQGMKYVYSGRNVVVGRTFSKLYGLAGARIGYAIAPEHIMNTIKRVAPPFPVNRIAQVGALAAMDDVGFTELTKNENERAKQYLYKEFYELGFDYSSANGNFVWVDTHKQSRDLENALLRRGVIIRAGHLWGLDTHMRVSIGTLEQCDKLIKALREIIK